MTKRKILSLLLTLAMAFSLLPANALAAEVTAADNEAVGYFYKQLNPQAQKIYEALSEMDFKSGTEDLALSEVVGQDPVNNYIDKGDRTLPNDFAAAKDAYDLDHSEIWYLDSSYLSLRPTKESGGTNEVWAGVGRADNYHLGGTLIEDVATKQTALDAVIDDIIAKANEAGENALSDSDKTAAMVTAVHDEITKRISYRYETDCKNGNAPYVRTIYALVTHEGVCEAYARSMQVILTKLNIPCVLIHGMQTSGTPEDHMWNAVKIDGTWYMVDATWDDPLAGNWDGTRADHINGLDGKETNKYLLVGQNKVGTNWRPSGIVSSGAFEFKYPEMSETAYTGEKITADNADIVVKYSTGSNMEDIPAGVFTVTYKGMNQAKAREAGYYFLIKMYQSYRDGTARGFDEWYYVDAALSAMGYKNQYFGDTDDGLRVYTGHCDYVELAVTTRVPKGVETWNNTPGEGNELSMHPEYGYFNGEPSEILETTGMLYNPISNYYAPPYVFTQDPGCNYQVVTGPTYRMKVKWDDLLYHPATAEDKGPIGEANQAQTTDSSGYQDRDDRADATAKPVRVKYTTVQPDRNYVGDIPSVLSKDPPYDADRDGYVDDGFIQWHYMEDQCPHSGEAGHVHDVKNGCPIDGLEFDFQPSDQWADDVTRYTFYLEGVVGSRSWKIPNFWEVTCVCPGSCPACYRSQGIDWNLWGRPMLLDNFSDLDLDKVMMEDFQGKQESLADLQDAMKIDRMNGRLMLSVEDISAGVGSREKYEDVTNALKEDKGIDTSKVLASALYEINFTRLCAKTMASPGQSMRVQIGYPAGVSYENFGESVVLKAYHFTRCDEAHEKDGKNCEVLKSELAADGDRKAHAWGTHIVSVEEIPIVPTPYGLVVMVDSFSPFEIVAMKADPDDVAGDTNILTGILTVANDENGSVSISDTGTNYKNMVKLEKDKSYTFTVTPANGYAFGTAEVSGDKLTVTDDGNNTVTVKVAEEYDGKANELINFTFVPQTVKAADEEAQRTAVAPKVCAHSDVKTTQAYVAPTCDAEGHTLGERCNDCGQVLKVSETIPALGHQYTVQVGEKTEPTCTSDGKVVMRCANCDETQTEVIPALDHQYTVQGERTEPTCTTEGKVEMKCATCEKTETEILPKVPHTYANGVCSVCGAKDPDYKPSSGGSGGSGGSDNTSSTVTNPDGSKTTTTTKPDGSKTETTKYTDGTVTEKVTKKDGSSTETTTAPDGVTGKTSADKNGVMTSAEVTVPSAAASKGLVTAPVEVKAAKDSKAAPEIDVKVSGGSAKVEIPVTGFGPGTVAVLVHEDGAEEVVRDCITGEKGIILNVEGDVTLKIVDNTMTFSDVEPVNHWATDAVEFVAARELFKGTGDGKFTPGGDMTRGMLVTVLYRLNYEPEAADGDFADVDANAYYADAVAWAEDAGVVSGYGSGKFGPNDDVTREQIVTILYRYAEKNGYLAGKTGSLTGYADAGSVSGWAADAMSWAIGTGLVKGVDDTHLAPTNNATRAEVATILMRFCESM